MKHKDHLLLAHTLMEAAPDVWDSRTRSRAFLLGNVLPDYNPFTYLRGFRQSRRMKGHNTLYSEKHIEKVIRKLRRNRLRSIADCYALGTLIHYLADSYTHPHTPAFRGSFHDHTDYENTLHRAFAAYLCNVPRPTVPEGTIQTFLRESRERYEHAAPSPETDAEWIFRVTSAVYLFLLFSPI